MEITETLPENVMKVLKARYLLKFEDGRQENPDDLFKRVAKAISNSDKEYNDFKQEKTEEIFNRYIVTDEQLYEYMLKFK